MVPVGVEVVMVLHGDTIPLFTLIVPLVMCMDVARACFGTDTLVGLVGEGVGALACASVAGPGARPSNEIMLANVDSGRLCMWP